MTKWVEITVVADLEAVEPLTELLSGYVYGGVAIEQEALPGGDAIDHPLMSDTARVSGYLPATRGWKQKLRKIEVAAGLLGQLRPISPISWRLVEEEDWANAWKQHYRPLRIGERIVVKPSWEDYPLEPNQVLVELDPGMAFGTGLHPTTQLCLRQLETLVFSSGMRVLDLGTGSGILAIAAARLGAANVLALDNDSVAVTSALRNVAMNGLEGIITVGEGSIGPDGNPIRLDVHRGSGESSGESIGPFDLVVANIVASVICELAEGLVRSLKPGGSLIASGIIDSKAELVLAALGKAGLTCHTTDQMGDWIAIVGTK